MSAPSLDISKIDGERLKEVEREIAVQEKRVAETDAAVGMRNGIMCGIAETDAADRRLKNLQAERRKLIEGVPAAPGSTEQRKSPGALRMPFRITEKEGSEGRKKPQIDKPLNYLHQEELQQIYKKHVEADVLERMEDEIQSVVVLFSNGMDSQRAFTQSLYVAFLRALAGLQAELSTVAEFQMLRRRELESKISTLKAEQSRKDVPALAQQIVAMQPLMARIAALEARPTLQYRGVYDAAEEYSVGHFVTYDGSLWAAKISTRGVEPGNGELAWQLAVKRGRDGRGKR